MAGTEEALTANLPVKTSIEHTKSALEDMVLQGCSKKTWEMAAEYNSCLNHPPRSTRDRISPRSTTVGNDKKYVVAQVVHCETLLTRPTAYLFLGFTVIYVVNIVVRIQGLSWKRFRRSSWDLYSLLAVTGTIVFTILHLANGTERTTVYNQLRKLFLVSIALLLIPRNNQLDQLFKTAAASLTAIGNLLATWFVLFLVYAIALTQTLGLTRFGSLESANLNFRTVPNSLILLFRMSCGEGWNQIMEDYAQIESPFCVSTGKFYESDCGSAAWARTLFISWNILSMYIFVSMFVSLIFESFSYVYQRSSGLSVVSREEIRRFKQAWATFDAEGSGYISKDQFPKLLGVSDPCCGRLRR